MKNLALLLTSLFLSKLLFSLPQVSVTLIADSGVKSTQYLKFDISNKVDVAYGFVFTNFSKDGNYFNNALYQHNDNLDTGNFKIVAFLISEKTYSATDSLFVDQKVSRITIIVHIATSDSTGDYIKEIKTTKYYNHLDFIKFSFTAKPKIGSHAIFNIVNTSDSTIYPYPNKSFFFGTLYEKFKDQGWTQYYPNYNDIKFCDTSAINNPLLKKQSGIAWTPNDDDCSKFIFTKSGDYYFELLYRLKESSEINFSGITRIQRISLGREIFLFTL